MQGDPPKSPIPIKPNLEMLQKAAVSISARQRKWGSNQETKKKEEKATPQINIPETTTKAAPAIVIENYPTEKDEKTTDKNGAPPPPPDEPCPEHLGSAIRRLRPAGTEKLPLVSERRAQFRRRGRFR